MSRSTSRSSLALSSVPADQVHFFWHYQEARRSRGTEGALAHALRVAGGAIVFATLVNAAGFLALALSDVPPVRQFGLLTAAAFAAALLADFTALPAALWVLSGDGPAVAASGPADAPEIEEPGA